MRIFIIGILVAITLTGCATTAQQQAFSIRNAIAHSVQVMKQCAATTYSNPKYAPLLRYLPSPENGFLPTMAQMTQNTYPTTREAKLLIAFHDDYARCKRPAIERLGGVAPDLAIVMTDAEIEGDHIALQLVRKKITWGKAAREMKVKAAVVQKKLVSALHQIQNNLTIENQAELAQRQQAADALMRWSMMQQAINAANRPILTTCGATGNFVNCVTQ